MTKNLLVFTLMGLSLVACKNQEAKADIQETTTTEVAQEVVVENLQTANFSIEGMQCAMGCAKTIEKKLAAMEGIKSASVNFDTKEAVVEYDATKQTPQLLAQAVEKMADGETYKVIGLKSSSDQSSVYKDQEQKKNKKGSKEDKASKEQKDSKESCHTEDKKGGEKKGSCCSSGSKDKKSSCSSEKTGSL